MGQASSSNLSVLVLVGGIKAQIPRLQQIPFYNQDYEDDNKIPQIVNDLNRMCIDSRLLLFVTPEYNSSMAPALKNAFDWLSRPSPIYQNKVPVFGKKAAVMSTSYISQQPIEQCIKMGGYRKLEYFEKPYYVNLGANKFDQKTGKLTDPEEQKRLVDWGQEMIKFGLKQPKEKIL